MRRPLTLAVAILLGITLAIATAYSQEDMESVDNGQFDNPQRPPAVFFHDAHNEKAGLDDCSACHHIFDERGRKLEGESSEDQMCSDCHGEKDQGAKPRLRKAYHLRCKGCHLEQQKGPILCAQCHVR
jgi:Class III cytochrome C family